MASWNLSRDASSHRDYSGGTYWRPPLLPQPEKGDNVRPVSLWERGFCRNAHGHSITWETFLENKRFIGFYPNVMDWDDSGALKNFLDAKERFRARFHGEPYEDPLPDPNMFIDEVDHHCEVDPEFVADLDKVAGVDELAELSLGGMGNLTPMNWGEPIDNLIPMGWGQPVPNLEPTGWGDEPSNRTPNAAWGEPVGNLIPSGWGQPVPNLEPIGWGDEPANPTPNVAWEGQVNETTEASVKKNETAEASAKKNETAEASVKKNETVEMVSGWHQQGVDPRSTSSGTARMLPGGGGRIWTGGVSGGGGYSGSGHNWNGGGRGSSGSGHNWNGGGRGNQRNQDVGRHQMWSGGGGSGMQRNKNVVEHQQRSGCRQQQGQRGRRVEWRPVQRNTPPHDGPAA